MLTWMQHHEARFQKKKTKNLSMQKSSPIKTSKHKKVETQGKLDAFFTPKDKSDLFDDDFNMSDFQLATQRWKEKNEIGMAAN